MVEWAFLTATAQLLKKLAPKSKVSTVYADMLSISFDFAKAQLDDEITHRAKHKLPILPEWTLKRFDDLINRHLSNQLELAKSNLLK